MKYGILLHDTVSSPRTKRETILRIVTKGVQQKKKYVPGPLYNRLVLRDGERCFITDKKANHGGIVDEARAYMLFNGIPMPPPTKRPKTGKKSFNRNMYGIARDNNGTEYHQAQEDALLEEVLELCLKHGWNEHHVAGHSELTKRKVDPGPWDSYMPEFRQRLREALKNRGSTPGAPPGAPQAAPVPPTPTTEAPQAAEPVTEDTDPHAGEWYAEARRWAIKKGIARPDDNPAAKLSAAYLWVVLRRWEDNNAND